eukprot:3715521-Pyramimonas_sp.AAC.1
MVREKLRTQPDGTRGGPGRAQLNLQQNSNTRANVEVLVGRNPLNPKSVNPKCRVLTQVSEFINPQCRVLTYELHCPKANAGTSGAPCWSASFTKPVRFVRKRVSMSCSMVRHSCTPPGIRTQHFPSGVANQSHPADPLNKVEPHKGGGVYSKNRAKVRLFPS